MYYWYFITWYLFCSWTFHHVPPLGAVYTIFSSLYTYFNYFNSTFIINEFLGIIHPIPVFISPNIISFSTNLISYVTFRGSSINSNSYYLGIIGCFIRILLLLLYVLDQSMIVAVILGNRYWTWIILSVTIFFLLFIFTFECVNRRIQLFTSSLLTSEYSVFFVLIIYSGSIYLHHILHLNPPLIAIFSLISYSTLYYWLIPKRFMFSYLLLSLLFLCN